METIIINIAIVFATFVTMEGVAWFTHKYIMHGLLWTLHKDHHKKESSGFFEHNDFFFLIFALPGIVALYVGSNSGYNSLLWVGLGITLYGLAYFLIHDIFIHQRFKVFRNSHSTYLKAIRKAHKVHHKKLHKEDGECFGMLWVPAKYLREINSRNQPS